METLRQLIAATPNGFLPTIVIGLVSLFSWYIRDGKPFSGFKLVGKEPGEWFNTTALRRWEHDPLKLIKGGFKATAGRPFQVMTESGPLIMIPLNLADEIRDDPRLTFAGFLERQQLTIYPGLDALHLSTKEEIIQETIRKHLTQALGGLTQRLSDEAAAVLDESLPTGNGKSTPNAIIDHIQFYMTAAQAAARLSALTFLGEELCRNPEWIDTSISFTGVALHSGNSLRAWPAILRPFVHHFLPELWYISAGNTAINACRIFVRATLKGRVLAETATNYGSEGIRGLLHFSIFIFIPSVRGYEGPVLADGHKRALEVFRDSKEHM
ncbi:cytochrome p450 [Colletotrichum asianum]